MFANLAWRVQRESWPSADALAQELFVIFRSDPRTVPVAYRLLRETWTSPARLAEEFWAIAANNNVVPLAVRPRIVREEWTDVRELADELYAIFRST